MHAQTLYDEEVYKASIARAAAPRKPAALVACAAPPVNVERVGVALVVPLPVAVAVAITDEAAEARLEATEATAEEAAPAADEVTAAALDSALATAELTAAAAELAAEGAAELASGMLMGEPACSQVDSTAEMVVAWSAALQAP